MNGRFHWACAWPCALLAVLLLVTPAMAIDPARRLPQCLHRIWQMQQDLPNATITCITQTSDGYLWLGTPEGLVRFDGLRFTAIPLTTDSSLTRINVSALAEDRQGSLWIGTRAEGLFRWRDGSVQRLRQADGLSSDDVLALLVDRHDTLWIGASAGVTRRAKGEMTSYGSADGLPGNAIHCLAETADGAIWAGGDGSGLGVWNGVEFVPTSFQAMPRDARIAALCATPTNGVWIGTDRGVLNVRGDREQWWTTREGLPDDRVHCLSYGANDSLWVGTQKGFSRIHADELDSFLPQDGLSQSTVYSLSEDREGSLWVGTKHGLNQFADRRTLPFTTREGLPSNDVGPVLQDREDAIWVGTRDHGLARYDGHAFTVLTVEAGLLSNRIEALALGDDGTLWVGTDRGINQLRQGRIVASFGREQGLRDDRVRCLLWSKQKQLMAGTDHGLQVLRDGAFHVVDTGPLGAMAITALSEAEDEDVVWIATDSRHGPFAYQNGEVREAAPAFRTDSPIQAILPWNDELWLGTQSSGILRIRDGVVARFGLDDGLYDDEIFGIAADDQGRLWMACSKGIFSVARSSFAEFASGQRRRLECMPFSPMDGQRTIECQADAQPALWRMRDGRIWFSTIHGLVAVDPSQSNRLLPKAPVLIEEVTVNGAKHRPAMLGEIPRGTNEISFRYSAISYRSPARITFQYRLDGFDKDWIDAGARREAFYTNLRPGDYQFRVAARNVDGQLSELTTPLAFTIRPLLYQTAWFAPTCFATVLLGGWLAYLWRMRWMKSRMQVVLSERTRIARELHDTLMQGFAGITMQLQALLGRLSESPERGRLREIIGDAGACLREARRSIAGLRGEAGGASSLGEAIAETARQLAISHDLELRLDVALAPVGLTAQVEYQVLRIAQEALANVVKHADARSMSVAWARRPGCLILTISDDGRGFPAGPTDDGDHFGLVGMRERAEQIGGKLEIDSALGGGTVVTLSLPLGTMDQDRPAPLAAQPQAG